MEGGAIKSDKILVYLRLSGRVAPRCAALRCSGVVRSGQCSAARRVAMNFIMIRYSAQLVVAMVFNRTHSAAALRGVEWRDVALRCVALRCVALRGVKWRDVALRGVALRGVARRCATLRNVARRYASFR